MKKYYKVLSAVFLLVFLIGSYYFFIYDNSIAEEKVDYIKIDNNTDDSILRATGNVIPEKTIDIKSSLSGEITEAILNVLDKPKSLIKFVKDRPGHDQRYAIDSSKMQEELGWEPEYTFEEGIKETINWYVNHQDWWRKIKSGEYKNYYEKMYDNR